MRQSKPPSDISRKAFSLEDRLPRIMRSLYRPFETDPLRSLPVAQLRLLRVLYPTPKTHSVVGEELGISVSAVTQVANRLEALGYVERIESPADRRVKNLKLTPYGADCMKARLDYRIQRTIAALESMPEEHQTDLLTLLDELIEGCKSLRDEYYGPVIASDLAEAGSLPLLGGES